MGGRWDRVIPTGHDPIVLPLPDRGPMYNMACWNALSNVQQQRLMEVGNLPWAYEPEYNECPNSASVEVTTVHDEAPGPRYYCVPCAIKYLQALPQPEGE